MTGINAKRATAKAALWGLHVLFARGDQAVCFRRRRRAPPMAKPIAPIPNRDAEIGSGTVLTLIDAKPNGSSIAGSAPAENTWRAKVYSPFALGSNDPNVGGTITPGKPVAKKSNPRF